MKKLVLFGLTLMLGVSVSTASAASVHVAANHDALRATVRTDKVAHARNALAPCELVSGLRRSLWRTPRVQRATPLLSG